MATKTTKTSNSQVTVTFKVAADVEKVYVVGNTQNLGAWDCKKAVELKKTDNGKFEVSKKFDANLHNAVMTDEESDAEVDTITEEMLKGYTYKDEVIRHSVEKGIWGEELQNHSFTAAKGLAVEVGVSKFGE